MLSFSRQLKSLWSLLVLPLAFAACGFSPVYGPGGTASALHGKVEVAAPGSVDSYLLVQNLEQLLGRGGQPTYALSLKLSTTSRGQAITASNETTRYSLEGRVDYVLRDISSNTVAASGRVDNFAGYSATGTTIETLASERDAHERLMVILADQITTRLYSLPDLAQ